MAGTASIVHNLTVDGDTAPQLGDSVPVDVSYASGLVYRLEDFVIADNYTATVLWAANALATFAFGIILSNVDILIELKNDLGTPEYTLRKVSANVPTYIDGTSRGGTTQRITTLVQTTGLGNIVQIKAQRNVADAVGDATIQLMLFL